MLPFCLLGAFIPITAQEWRSVYYGLDWVTPHERDGLNFLTDSFIQDFSYAGYHRGEKPLPTVTEGIVDAVEKFAADPSGQTDSTSAIQAAIDHVTDNGGGVVFLPAGTYQVSPQTGFAYCLLIDKPNIVLRGEGVDKTFILNTSHSMRNSEVIRVERSGGGSWRTQRGPSMIIEKDYQGPTLEAEVHSVRHVAVGDWVIIHNPATEAFVNDINMGEGPDGVSWVGDSESLQGPRWYRQVKAINDKTLIFDAPTRWSLNVRDGAKVYRADELMEEVGLEGFSVGNVEHPGTEWGENDYSNSVKDAWHVHNSWLIRFQGVRNGWIRDVSSFAPDGQNVHMLSNGILIKNSRGITLYQVSMTNAQYGGGGGNGYMIRLNEANECLVVDSEVGFCRHGIVQWRMENSGNVFLRNYDHDTAFQWGRGEGERTSGRGSDHHGLFSFSNLFDSNVVERSFFEAAYRGDWGNEHGMTASQVVYWNTIGNEYWGSSPFVVHTQQFGQGYVIGTSGEATGVNTSEKRGNSAVRTDPVDFIEGEGEGALLAPQSLYVDQFLKRIENLDAVIHCTISRQGESIDVEWRLPPGLQGVLESSENLEQWSDVIDIPEAEGSYTTEISAQLFFRIVGK